MKIVLSTDFGPFEYEDNFEWLMANKEKMIEIFGERAYDQILNKTRARDLGKFN